MTNLQSLTYTTCAARFQAPPAPGAALPCGAFHRIFPPLEHYHDL